MKELWTFIKRPRPNLNSLGFVVFQSSFCSELHSTHTGLQAYLVRLYLETQTTNPASVLHATAAATNTGGTSNVPTTTTPTLSSDVAEHLKGLIKVQV